MSDHTIRPERPADFEAIRQVVVAAFESDAEGDLVDNIRASANYLPDLSLVAELDGDIVGQVMVSRVELVDGDIVHEAHSLAPVAVSPDVHGQGIGGALIRAVLELADAKGLPLVLLEGSPVYYRRFGFEHSVQHGVEFDLPDWAPPEAAQMVRLSNYDPSIRGRVRYPPAFDVG